MIDAARRCARWLLLALPPALALAHSSIVSPPFSAPKNAILLLATSGLAAVALLSSAAWRPGTNQRRFWIAAAVFVALNIFAAVLSHHPMLAVESVEWIVCGALLIAAASELLSGEDSAICLRNLLIAITSAAGLVSFVTIAQFAGIDLSGLFGAYSNGTGRMRMVATLGNPDFVATFLAAAMPAALGLALLTRRFRALSVASAVLIGVAILLTGSRGGALAMTAGIAVVALTAMRRQPWSRFAVIAVLLAVCAATAGTEFNARTPVESMRGRIFIWQVSLSGGEAQLPLGSGPGTFAYDYPTRLGRFFAQPGHEPLLRFATQERHAQNDFVEAWHDTGWLGLTSQLALLGAWFALALRRLRAADVETRPAVSAAIATVTALCVASLFDFPMHRAETWAMLYLSMAVPLVRRSSSIASVPRSVWPRYAGAVSILVLGGFSAFAPLAASYQLAKAERNENEGQLQLSVAAYRAALRWQPSSPDANFSLARVLANSGDLDGALAQSIVAANYVDEPELYILRSRILANAGRDDEARRVLDAAVPVFPYSTDLRDEAAAYAPHPAAPMLPER